MKITIAHLYRDLSKSISGLKNDKSSIRKSRTIVEEALNRDEPMYGINKAVEILQDRNMVKEVEEKFFKAL